MIRITHESYTLMTESCCVMSVLHIYDLHSFSFSRLQLGPIRIRIRPNTEKPMFGSNVLLLHMTL